MGIKFILPVVALTSCAGSSGVFATRTGSPVAIQYEVRDAPSEKRIYVSFRNYMKRPICLGAENWPSNGILLNNGTEVSVMSGGNEYMLQAEQDYCPRCSTKIAPSAISSAYFKYESFKLPESESLSKKELSFHPVGYQC